MISGKQDIIKCKDCICYKVKDSQGCAGCPTCDDCLDYEVLEYCPMEED